MHLFPRQCILICAMNIGNREVLFLFMLSSNTHKLKMFQFCLPSKNSIILHTYIQLHEHPLAKDCEHGTVIYTEYFAVVFALLSQPLYLKFSQSVLVCCAVICFGRFWNLVRGPKFLLKKKWSPQTVFSGKVGPTPWKFWFPQKHPVKTVLPWKFCSPFCIALLLLTSQLTI